MLVKLQSTEMTAQRLSINLHTLTNRCCFGRHNLLISFALFLMLHKWKLSLYWQKMKSIEEGRDKEWGQRVCVCVFVFDGGVPKVMEYKGATLLLFSK